MKRNYIYLSLSILILILIIVIILLFSKMNIEDNSTSSTISPEITSNLSTNDSTNHTTQSTTSNINTLPLSLNESFITGADISSIIALEESGVIFYDYAGNSQDIFKTLYDNGINYIRVRLWNNPYDEAGNTYGGGHNDLATAIKIGKRATQNNLPLYVDFHYSDFWADPSKQMVPKSWSSMNLSEKEAALYDYTKISLESLINEGINIGMVQVGNETNYCFCGETSWDSICLLLNAGVKAVREVASEYNMNINIALHFTNPEIPNNYKTISYELNKHNVDYDIFASSYYPYWHGDLDNLVGVLSYVADTYNKKVMVAETAYPYTLQDTDFFDNSINSYNYTSPIYEVSSNGQRNYIYDLASKLSTLGSSCLGFFYWEPAWISVGNSYNENSKLWETYGSGWASSFSKEYDANDAGKYFGGSSFDNQALFDQYGKPLTSLSIFKELRTN